MNDVERLESLRGRVQHLGTVSQEDTRWLWEMARREINAVILADSEPQEPVNCIPPLAPQRKRCDECGGDCVFASGIDGKLMVDCQACGGSGYQPLENPE